MSVTKEQVLATAALARLDLTVASAHSGTEASTDATVTRLAAQLGAVVGYMDILNQVDTTGVEPLYSPLQQPAPPRPDKAEKHLTAEEILANAPKKHQTFFAVPPVI